MTKPFDPWAVQKGLWRTFGWAVAENPFVTRADIDAMHRTFEQQSLMTRRVNPAAADILSEMATEFHRAAIEALVKRQN